MQVKLDASLGSDEKFVGIQSLIPNQPQCTGAGEIVRRLHACSLCVRQGYEELERQLKEVFKERSNILRQLSKTSRELDGIKVNLQSLKNDEASAKSDVQKLLELGKKQREEMKSLQEAFQKQLNEAAEKAEKQQATINFLKTEMERKSKMIRDLQNENKSLKNKLLSGNKLCGIHAEESKKIQAQLKELRYGKKDLIFKAQQLTDLEQKLAVAKDELEKAALDKESQLKALKETVQLCLTSVLRNQPPAMSLMPSKLTERRLPSPNTNDSKVPAAVTSKKVHFIQASKNEIRQSTPLTVSPARLSKSKCKTKGRKTKIEMNPCHLQSDLENYKLTLFMLCCIFIYLFC
uniref:Leucine zipper protein 2 n=1 Tax=Vombatus ursinus TaxID=29139 RepID=A0A4X2JZ91_VOMUR